MTQRPKHLAVMGLQWGDEGKGKIVDVLSKDLDVVVRYQGGANAGHTIVVGDEKTVLHLLPSGVMHPDKLAVLGNGMVIDAESLLSELDGLESSVVDRIWLSSRAHVTLPYHKRRDAERESGSGERKIGTTLRGIGPTYEDKFARRGIRFGDLKRANFIDEVLPTKLRAQNCADSEIAETQTLCRALLDRVGHRVADTELLLREFDEDGKRFLFEGAQGCLLDIDFGTYPFVTSSSPSLFGIGSGTGFSPRKIDHVLGVTKVYTTRVGEGPFPSEMLGEEGDALREAGGEYGATTGRPRRCGTLDIPLLRYAVRINDVDSLVLTKSDVLSGWSEVPVAVAYELDGERIDDPPVCSEDMARVTPVVEKWPGWTEASLEAMKPFIERLEAAVGVPVSIVSTGRRRDEVVFAPDYESWSPS